MHNGQRHVGGTIVPRSRRDAAANTGVTMLINQASLFVPKLWGFFLYQIEPKMNIFSIKTVKYNSFCKVSLNLAFKNSK